MKAALDDQVIFLAMPTRGSISAETFWCTRAHMDGYPNIPLIAPREPVSVARNMLAAAIKKAVDEDTYGVANREQFVLWCDDDAWWAPGCVATAISVLKARSDVDMLAGCFGPRSPLARCAGWDCDGKPLTPEHWGETSITNRVGDLIEVSNVGFHWVVHRPGLLTSVGPNPFSLQSTDVFSEDAAFCRRVRQTKGRIFLATGLSIAHVEAETGEAYLPYQPTYISKLSHLVDAPEAIRSKSPYGQRQRSYGADVDAAKDRYVALYRNAMAGKLPSP